MPSQNKLRVAVVRLVQFDDGIAGSVHGQGAAGHFRPGPGIAEPDGRQQVEFGRIRTAIGDCDANKNIFGRRLRILDKDIEVTIVVENPRVDQLEFTVALVRGVRFSSTSCS